MEKVTSQQVHSHRLTSMKLQAKETFEDGGNHRLSLAGDPRSHSVTIRFPDDACIKAFPLSARQPGSSDCDFGLYMDPAWAPTWDAEMIGWPDFGVPDDWERAAGKIKAAFMRAEKREQVVKSAVSADWDAPALCMYGCPCRGWGGSSSGMGACQLWHGSCQLWHGCVPTMIHALSKDWNKRSGCFGSGDSSENRRDPSQGLCF